MIHLCTVSDYNYLDKGLALLESLKRQVADKGSSGNFVLHYLCIDGQTYEKLDAIKDENLRVYHCDMLTDADPALKNLKGANYKYFCWSLASYWSNWLLRELEDAVTYIDSDIYFHQPIEELLEVIGEHQVAIFRHRQFPLEQPRPEGWFNVGVVHFKHDKIGKRLLKWWADAVLHQKYPHLATCGDQKYLDNFLGMCPEGTLFADGDIGHGAPWQWQLYDMSQYKETGDIIWGGERQKLMFTHFSQFVYKPEDYVPSAMHHIYTPLEAYKGPGLKEIYDEYHQALTEVRDKYSL